MRNLIHNEESIASIIRESYISLFTTRKVSAPISIRMSYAGPTACQVRKVK